jgi:hypothetical protein
MLPNLSRGDKQWAAAVNATRRWNRADLVAHGETKAPPPPLLKRDPALTYPMYAGGGPAARNWASESSGV